ncbi:MAG: TonB-dependent receptor [Chromatiales bacterium]|nr:TonB-dependent receptor [Chromatiales bacterium]
MDLRLLAAGLVLPLSLSAQQPQSLLPPMDDMLIIAGRTPLATQEVGSVFSLIDRAEIERRQAVFALDLLRDLPGISVSRSGGFGSQTQLRIRGAEANHVLVLIDGVKANDPAGNDEFALEHLTTFDIERIEVIRGPQSALWGSDALAGVVNIVTRRASRPLSEEAWAEGGSFSTWSGGVRLGVMGERTRLSVSGSLLGSDGINIAREGDERDGYRNRTGTVHGGWQPVDSLELSLFARHSDNNREFDGIDFGTGLPVDADRRTRSSQTYLRAGARLYSPGYREQQLRVTWLDTDIDSFADGQPDGRQAGDKLGAYWQGGLPLFAGDSGPVSDRLTAALEYERETFRQSGIATEFGDPNQRQRMSNRAAALEYLIQPVVALTLSASLRHDQNSDFRSVTTWRGTGTWTLPAWPGRVHASFGTGQKSPTFVERFGFFPDQFAGNPQLRPERSRGWDAGIEHLLWDGRLRIDTSYFRADLRDEIDGFVFEPDLGLFTARNAPGRSRRQGVEITVDAELAASLQFSGSWTWVDATEPGASGASVREIRRPRHSAAGNLNWRWADGRGNVNMNASWVGSRDDLLFAGFPAERVRLGSYTLLNLAASWQAREWLVLHGRIENLLDAEYEDVIGFSTPGIGVFAGFRIMR